MAGSVNAIMMDWLVKVHQGASDVINLQRSQWGNSPTIRLRLLRSREIRSVYDKAGVSALAPSKIVKEVLVNLQ